MDSSAGYVFWACFTFGFISFLWELYLSWRQYSKKRDTPELPGIFKEIIDEEAYKKSRLYSLDKERFSFVSSIWSAFENSVVLLLNLLVIFWDISGHIVSSWGYNNEILQSMVFIALTILISTVLNFPWKIYHTFVIEEKHGFNKQTFGFFVKDQIKALLLTLLIGLPVLATLIWIIKIGGDYFFVFVWIFLLVLTLFLATVYPEFIAPLFDKYTPLKEGELKTKIESLASKLSFPLKKLYVVEGSKRSAHSNAYMYGFWNNKRIVLYDTLIANYHAKNAEEKPAANDGDTVAPTTSTSKDKSENSTNATTEDSNGEWEKPNVGDAENSKKLQSLETASNASNIEPETISKTESPSETTHKDLGMNDDEVVAVLGHELGHWKLNHTLYNIVVSELNMLLCLVMFSFLYKWTVLYEAFGFTKSQPTLIGLVIILQFVFAPYNELLHFLMTCWSRRCEFAADQFSAELGMSEQLSSSLIKMGKDNLSNPINDRLYSQWHHSHPPLAERLEALKKFL